MSASQPIEFVKTLPPEEGARADLYAVLSILFYAGPSEAMLKQVAQAQGLVAEDGSALANAWRALRETCATSTSAMVTAQYEALFIGVGRAPVSIYASHYLSESWKDHTLVNLRDELARLGLARQAGAVEPEDHLAGLLDVMRHLVLRERDGDVALQEGFFRSYLAPWYAAFAQEVLAQPDAAFYAQLAIMLKAFLDIEIECFQIA